MKKLTDYSLFEKETQECPFDYYKLLRDEAPVYKLPEVDFYIVSRYEDVRVALRNPKIFSSNFAVRGQALSGQPDEVAGIYQQHGWVRKNVLRTDPPRHTMNRKLVDQAFTPARVRAMEPYIDALVSDLIEGWIDDGEIEFIRQFAGPLPMVVICDRLGIARDMAPQCRVWSNAHVDSLMPSTPRERHVEAAWQLVDFQHYFVPMFDERRREPRDDILSDLVNTVREDGTHLETEELLDILESMLAGGNETTTLALGSGMLKLATDFTLWGSIRNDSAHLKTFVEEVLRLDAPTQGLFRRVTEETELGGVRLEEGTYVNLRYGCANRDERQFPDPDGLDFERRNAGAHLAFGSGIHHCVGAPLARQELISAFRALLERLDNVRLSPAKPAPEQLHNFMQRGLKHLHITFDRNTQRAG